jgi:hypothetical protein
MNKAKPTQSQVNATLKKWGRLENYVLQERSLTKLFTQTYTENKEIDEVLIKVCSLNDFYSTNIFSPFTVAKHIISLKIDKKLAKEDLSIVNEIALIKMSENKVRNFYSFATKYCSHHKPNAYPIYDSFVEKMLLLFNKIDKFSIFKKDDLKTFANYKKIILEFRDFYKLNCFDLKEIDKYLWLKGKEYFPKQY